MNRRLLAALLLLILTLGSVWLLRQPQEGLPATPQKAIVSAAPPSMESKDASTRLSETQAAPEAAAQDWSAAFDTGEALDETIEHCLASAARGELEGYRCMFEANLGCYKVAGLDRAGLVAHFDQRIAADDPVQEGATDERNILLRCKALWQRQPLEHDAQHWFELRFKARDPVAVLQRVTACGSGLPLSARKDLLTEAWLKADLEAITLIESKASMADVSEAPGLPNMAEIAGIAYAVACRNADSVACRAYQRRLGEKCEPPLCPAEGRLLDRLQMWISPARLEEMQRYAQQLKEHLDRKDTEWPAIQHLLQSMQDC